MNNLDGYKDRQTHIGNDTQTDIHREKTNRQREERKMEDEQTEKG